MQPYLSIVVPSRNDNHGGDLLRRMQIFVTALLEQCRRFDLAAELIVVEWNPPSDRPRLAEVLKWPPSPCAVRIIEVPASIHRRYRHADELALYQMIAKNAGIRRARGEFVLATNVDLLFSDELMRFIAERRLEVGRMYRIDRSDVSADVPDAPVERQLAWCASHLLRINGARGTSSVKPDGAFTFESNDIASGGMTLGAGWFAREMQGTIPFRWVDNDAEIFIDPPAKVLAIDVEPGPGVRKGSMTLDVFDGARMIFSARLASRRVLNIPLEGTPIRLRIQGGGHIIEGEPRPLNLCVRHLSLHPAGEGVRGLWWALRRRLGRAVLPGPRYADCAPDFLHIAACGDFTLLARAHWFDLRGYPEFDLFPMNVDALFCFAAHYGGARECVLAAPMRAYHVEHESGWTPQNHTKLFERLKKNGMPWLEQADMLRWGFDMSRTNSPMIFNRDDWGLANETLKES